MLTQAMTGLETALEKKLTEKKSTYDVPKPFLYVWIALSTLGNLTGIASICDGIVEWVGIFGQYITFYQENIRAPINDFLSSIWLHFIFEMPAWMGDYFVILGAYATSMALFGLMEGKNASVFSLVIATLKLPQMILVTARARKVGNFRLMALVTLCFFVAFFLMWVMAFFFPFIHLFTVVFILLATGKFPKGIYKTATWYVAGTVSVFLVALALNFQIKEICADIAPQDRNGFCVLMMG